MFTNIAIVSLPGPGLQAIRNQLRNPVRFTVREFLSLDDVNHGLTAYPFDVLLIRLNAIDAAHVGMLLRMRQRFPGAGIVAVSPEIDPGARFQVRDLPRLKLLQEPVEVLDLPQVIDKLANGDASAMRLHMRVPRDGECELVDVETGVRLKAKFIDFAQMGARLQVNPKVPIKRHRRLQLHYKSSSDPGRFHKIESTVVWGEVNSGMVGTIMNGPQQVVGLRFIASL